MRHLMIERPASVVLQGTVVWALVSLWSFPQSLWAQGDTQRLLRSSYSVSAEQSPQVVKENEEEEDLFALDITELSKVSVAPAFEEVVTSVTRQESTVGRSAAAIFVITNDMIRRSGVRSVPEALRLAPGVNVGRVDSNKWSISIRGFQLRFANKLLVQIDGRSVYNNSFAGVYWDVQDLLLDDIDRIEIIRGPGATIWGSNAVSGVINIVTKSAKDTTGLYAIAGGGTEERAFVGGRLGGVAAGGDLHWRASGKWFERDEGFLAGIPAADGAQQGRGAFRMDWTPNACDTVTIQGDIFRGSSGSLISQVPSFVALDEQVQGANVLARWTHNFGKDESVSVQTYLDQSIRREGVIDARWDVFDLDFQHRKRIARWHNFIWGLRYRHTEDELVGAPGLPLISFNPTSRFVDMYSGFAQDEMTLIEDELYFTLGTKLELNQFTDWEWQPNARLLAVLDERRIAWAAVSRAVRTPSNSERDSIYDLQPAFGTPFSIVGNPQVDSEDVMSYEVGYRAQPAEYFSWDVTSYYNVYDNFVDVTPIGIGVFRYNNDARGQVYGIELSGALALRDHWRLLSHYSFTKSVARNSLFSSDGVFDHPRNQFYMRSSWEPCEGVEIDLTGRYIDNQGGSSVLISHYFLMDLRLGWYPNERLELAVVGQNLLDAEFLEEFDSNLGLVGTQMQRGVYGSMTMRF